MHFSNILIAATAFFGATQAVTVSYDTGYDDPSRSLTTVSCSDGVNGLITKYGWQTQGDVHRFPLIGGKAPISWNSAECGTCWTLSYKGRSINVLAIDHAQEGFNLAAKAMEQLEPAYLQVGRIDAQVASAPLSACGI